jgi:hypothetical protein
MNSVFINVVTFGTLFVRIRTFVIKYFVIRNCD